MTAFIRLNYRLTFSKYGALSKCVPMRTLSSEYLHHSVMPTNHFQKSLPRLPIPKLEETCLRYLKALQPLLKDDEMRYTSGLVDQFQKRDGKDLHDELVALDKANKHTSYISGPWYDMYLSYRPPIVFNHNPFMAFNPDPRQEYNTQLLRSTNMIVSAMKFLKTYRESILEPEVFHLNPAKSDTKQFRNFVKWLPAAISWYGAYLYKAFPLDMSQFPRLYNSTRIPRKNKDELFTDTSARHIAVQRNGHIYVFDVLNPDGTICSPNDIMAHIQYILTDNQEPAEYPIGVLTSENRDIWADLRDSLVNLGNEEKLKLIDSAVFMLSLDDYAPKHDRDVKGMSGQFLHGVAGNRWFDKSFSLLMASDGTASVNFEHAWGDGVAVLRYFNETFEDTTTNPAVHPDSKASDVDSSKAVRKLDFNLDEKVKKGIKTAITKFQKTAASLDMDYIEMEDFGRDYLKTKKIGPDAFMQLSFQMAYSKQYGRTVGSYESCSTSAFRHGRTETIRPCTNETAAASEMFNSRNSTASVNEMQDAIRKCSVRHNQLTKEAAMGQGFDRHLFAMRKLAEKKGDTLPALYNDPAYTFINHINISTSTLSSPAVLIGGFAPVVPDGYGVGYAINDNKLGCIISSYPPATNVADFIQAVKESVSQMHSVLEGNDFRS